MEESVEWASLETLESNVKQCHFFNRRGNKIMRAREDLRH